MLEFQSCVRDSELLNNQIIMMHKTVDSNLYLIGQLPDKARLFLKGFVETINYHTKVC